MKPVLIFNEVNRSIKPIAVTISGFIIGRLLICSVSSLTIRLDLDRPMAAIVPTIVETTVAITAMTTV